jgi:hypothetical protein
VSIPCDLEWGQAAKTAIDDQMDAYVEVNRARVLQGMPAVDLRKRGDDLFDLVLTWTEILAEDAWGAIGWCREFLVGLPDPLSDVQLSLSTWRRSASRSNTRSRQGRRGRPTSSDKDPRR